MNPDISIVLPCRDEEKAIAKVLNGCLRVIKQNNYSAEIIVSDSSKDRSPEIVKEFAKKNGEIVLVKHDLFGYGNAYLNGFEKAKGKFIVMLDADGSYDLGLIPKFVEELKKGAEFVIGNRFNGKMEKGAMPKSHRLIGNPVLSSVLRVFFGSKVKDSHCGMRAIKKKCLDKLDLRSSGMEFASEMVIKAERYKLKISQFDVPYKVRIGESKLRTFRDGWRHLRFMLIFSPLFLFFIPGLILMLLGFFSGAVMYFSLDIFGRHFDFHPMFISSLLIILGYQAITFAVFSRTYSSSHFGFGGGWLSKLYKKVNLEVSILFGLALILLGFLIFSLILLEWVSGNFGELNQAKNAIVASTLIVLGFQTIFSGFMLSILGINNNLDRRVFRK